MATSPDNASSADITSSTSSDNAFTVVTRLSNVLWISLRAATVSCRSEMAPCRSDTAACRANTVSDRVVSCPIISLRAGNTSLFRRSTIFDTSLARSARSLDNADIADNTSLKPCCISASLYTHTVNWSEADAVDMANT